MIGLPPIVRLGHVAQVLAMPLSGASKEILQRTSDYLIYIDRTKTQVRILQRKDVLEMDNAIRAFVVVPSNLCSSTYLKYLLNTAPLRRNIDEARETRSLSVSKLNDFPIPLLSREMQVYVEKIDKYIQLFTISAMDGHMDADLAVVFLRQISVAINTELYFPELCAINNIHVMEQWMMFLSVIPDGHLDILPSELLKPGNRLMSEVRALQRVMANAQKSIQDGAED